MTGCDESKTPWVEGQTVGSVLRTTSQAYPDHDAVVFSKLELTLVLARA